MSNHDNLSDEELLELIIAEWERGGLEALTRFVETHRLATARALALIAPGEFRRAVEELLVNLGLTDAELLEELERLREQRRH